METLTKEMLEKYIGGQMEIVPNPKFELPIKRGKIGEITELLCCTVHFSWLAESIEGKWIQVEGESQEVIRFIDQFVIEGEALIISNHAGTLTFYPKGYKNELLFSQVEKREE